MAVTDSFLQFHVDGSTLRVSLTSQRDVLSISDPEIRLRLLQAILEKTGENIDLVVLDLEELSRVNSAVLGFFVELSKELEARKIRFGVVQACPSIIKVMELTRLNHFVMELGS